jgi:DNA-binding LytR/AlgR family response regulator
MKLDCIIVDDEPLSRNFLARFCTKSERADVKGIFSNARDAMVYIKSNVVQVIFLDVEMPGLNGFQMLDQLSYMPKVIMTTSNVEYAFTAFEYNVTDFLKKPIDYNRFLEALTKAEEAIKAAPPTGNPKFDVVIKSNGSYVRLSHDDILYVESMGDYVKYVTTEKPYITHSTMRTAEESLNNNGFVKVHRSYIVNVKKITAFSENNVTINGVSIPVSKTNKSLLVEKLKTS